MHDNLSNKNNSRIESFEELTAIFAANGIEVTENIKQLLQPVIDGSVGYKEQLACLATRLNELQND